MKMRFGYLMALAFAAALASLQAGATVVLNEYGFNIDGTVSDLVTGDTPPGGVDTSAFDDASGLGTIVVTITGSGSHSFDFFIDLEIDEASNGYANEFGTVTGTPNAHQTWEIDEPGWVFGDIYANFEASAYDGTNAIPAGSEDDVSLGLGWDFVLGQGDVAKIILESTSTLPYPMSLFYLTQTDPDSGANVYLFGDLLAAHGPIPAPATLWLLGSGLLAWGGMHRRHRR